MAFSIPFNINWLEKLIRNPGHQITDSIGNNRYTAKLAIPNYRRNIERHFKDIIEQSLQHECKTKNIPFNFEHFGVEINFHSSIEISAYDSDLVLHHGLCEIMEKIGPIILRNVHLEPDLRNEGHRNRFPNLQFHIDRSIKQTTRYSFYTRDPFDEEQKKPRTASTLFIANISAYLQAVKQDPNIKLKQDGPLTSKLLFENEDIEKISGNVLLRQPWNEPEGTGEIVMIDNATVLHASFYHDIQKTGYKIGVRYLSGK